MKDRTKKTSTIILSAKKDNYRLILALAHYSLRLSSVFVFEQCFAYLLFDHFVVKGLREPYKVEQLYANGLKLADIFRSEHILIDDVAKDRFESRVSFLTNEGVFAYNKEDASISMVGESLG